MIGRFLILRCGDPVGHLLLRVFPLALCLSRAFHRLIVRDQVGDDPYVREETAA